MEVLPLQTLCAVRKDADFAGLPNPRPSVRDEWHYPHGWLFTMTRLDALNGSDSIHFLKHLYSQTDRKLLVIWDGSPIHRSKEVRAFLANGAAKQIHLERLPAYAPDLNPDEAT